MVAWPREPALDTRVGWREAARMSSGVQESAGGEADPAFHYPRDLLEQLVDTIPLLFRSKKAVLLFFEGAGVPREDYAEIQAELEADGAAPSKYVIARTVLTRLNQRADAGLRSRREIIKRVVEFEDFGTTWDGDRMRAKGQVASIRERVNVQDSFTRMAKEREAEAGQRREAHDERQRALREWTAVLDAARADVFALFGESNPQRRGKLAEKALNAVFAAHGMSVRDAFELVGDDGEGVVEQIDGVIELDGSIYLVE